MNIPETPTYVHDWHYPNGEPDRLCRRCGLNPERHDPGMTTLPDCNRYPLAHP